MVRAMRVEDDEPAVPDMQQRVQARGFEGVTGRHLPGILKKEAQPERSMKTILVVDDHWNLGLLYQQELSDEGYQVEVLQDGHQAIERVAQDPPDLLVLEIHLRGISGVEVMRQIAARNRALPVVLNTVSSRREDDIAVGSADAWVIKSSNLTELKRIIREVLACRQPEPW